jgi:hypothetical protein
MSNRETIKEAKNTLSQINRILKTEPLTARQRKAFEIHAAKLAGVIMHGARPTGVRKLLIFVISTAMVIGGLYLLARELSSDAHPQCPQQSRRENDLKTGGFAFAPQTII